MPRISDKTFLVNKKKECSWKNRILCCSFYVIKTAAWHKGQSQAQKSKWQHTSECYKMLYYKIVNNASAKCCAEPLCVIVFYWKEMSSGLHRARFNLKVTATRSTSIQRATTQLHRAQMIQKIKKQDQLQISFTRHISWYQTLRETFAATISRHFKVKVNHSCHK